MSATEMTPVIRSTQLPGCVEAMTPSGTPIRTAIARLVSARMSVCGSAPLMRVVTGTCDTKSIPRLPSRACRMKS